ncbi:hypothetical protein Tco_0453296 [Tanacetum coccineum]
MGGYRAGCRESLNLHVRALKLMNADESMKEVRKFLEGCIVCASRQGSRVTKWGVNDRAVSGDSVRMRLDLVLREKRRGKPHGLVIQFLRLEALEMPVGLNREPLGTGSLCQGHPTCLMQEAEFEYPSSFLELDQKTLGFDTIEEESASQESDLKRGRCSRGVDSSLIVKPFYRSSLRSITRIRCIMSTEYSKTAEWVDSGMGIFADWQFEGSGPLDECRALPTLSLKGEKRRDSVEIVEDCNGGNQYAFITLDFRDLIYLVLVYVIREDRTGNEYLVHRLQWPLVPCPLDFLALWSCFRVLETLIVTASKQLPDLVAERLDRNQIDSSSMSSSSPHLLGLFWMRASKLIFLARSRIRIITFFLRNRFLFDTSIFINKLESRNFLF